MSIAKRLPRFESLAASVAGIVMVLAGCTDSAVSPRTTDESTGPRTTGVLVTSLWRPAETGLDYVGSVSGRVASTAAEGWVYATGGAPTALELPQSEVETLRSALSTSAAQLSQRSFAGLHYSSPSGRAPMRLLRPVFTGRSIEQVAPDGKRIRVQFQEEGAGVGGPPRATAIFVNERLAVLSRNAYARGATGWVPARAEVTLFDSTGAVAVVFTLDLRAMAGRSSSFDVLGLGRLEDRVARVCRQFGQWVAPAPLYAASMSPEGGPCWEQFYTGLLAAGATGGSLALFTAALASCSGFVISCPAMAAALAASGLSFGALAETILAYWACINQWGGSGGGGGGGGGGGEPRSHCLWETWEISYDGGETWSYYGTFYVCYGDVMEA